MFNMRKSRGPKDPLRRNLSDYVSEVARITGHPKWKVKLVLLFAWKNIVRTIEKGEEIRYTGLGRIYFIKRRDMELADAKRRIENETLDLTANDRSDNPGRPQWDWQKHLFEEYAGGPHGDHNT